MKLYCFCFFMGSMFLLCKLTRRQQDEQKSATTATGHVKVTLGDSSTKLNDTTNTSSKVRNC